MSKDNIKFFLEVVTFKLPHTESAKVRERALPPVVLTTVGVGRNDARCPTRVCGGKLCGYVRHLSAKKLLFSEAFLTTGIIQACLAARVVNE